MVSNRPQIDIVYKLSVVGLETHFRGKIYSTFDANSWKPEPDILCYVATSMGFTTDQCLYVDDGKPGILAGVRSGMKTLYFCSEQVRESDGCAEIEGVDTISNIYSVCNYLQ